MLCRRLRFVFWGHRFAGNLLQDVLPQKQMLVRQLAVQMIDTSAGFHLVSVVAAKAVFLQQRLNVVPELFFDRGEFVLRHFLYGVVSGGSVRGLSGPENE